MNAHRSAIFPPTCTPIASKRNLSPSSPVSVPSAPLPLPLESAGEPTLTPIPALPIELLVSLFALSESTTMTFSFSGGGGAGNNPAARISSSTASTRFVATSAESLSACTISMTR